MTELFFCPRIELPLLPNPTHGQLRIHQTLTSTFLWIWRELVKYGCHDVCQSWDCGFLMVIKAQFSSTSLLLINWIIINFVGCWDWDSLRIGGKKSSGVQEGWRKEGLRWYHPADLTHWVLKVKNIQKARQEMSWVLEILISLHVMGDAGKSSRIRCTDCLSLACRDLPGDTKQGE